MSASGPSEHGADGNQQRAEGQETEVPPDRATEVVADVVDAQELVVHQSLHEVERAPAGKQETDVEAPWRRESAGPPGRHRHGHRDRHDNPSSEVEEAVRERVRLEARDRGARLPTPVAGEHVMPLEHLVEHDAVEEAAQADAKEKAWCEGRPHGVPLPDDPARHSPRLLKLMSSKLDTNEMTS
jgi:hypothetical protein